MGWRLRRRVKILPGVYVNVGKKGVSSVSVGGRGLTTSISKRGVRRTVSIPGTGISHQTFQPHGESPEASPLRQHRFGLGIIAAVALLGLAAFGQLLTWLSPAPVSTTEVAAAEPQTQKPRYSVNGKSGSTYFVFIEPAFASMDVALWLVAEDIEKQERAGGILQIIFWNDATSTPKALPMTAAQAKTEIARIMINPKLKLRKLSRTTGTIAPRVSK